MAEAIAISLSAKLAVALSRSAALGLSPLLGVQSEIAAAARDLDLLRAFLRFVDSHHGTDALAAAWVKQVRDAAFELEDVADECCYLSGSGHGRGRARGWVNVRARLALVRQLRKARERLRQLSAAKEQYGIRSAAAAGPAPPAAAISQVLAESAHFVEKEEIVGFAAHEKQLLEWVVDDPDPRRTLVSVWGMGGVGKTTLVTRVFREAAPSHFDCGAWVAVSQRFTVDDLLRKIVKELQAAGGGDAGAGAGYRSLVEDVRGHLRNRRYLVVLDDVWDAHLLEKLRHAFVDDATGSRVVITTRSRDVAKAAAHGRTMTLEPLPWREAWTLFCNVAFKESSRSCPSHLQEIAANVLERCRGLPLAIVSVANLLALKDTTEFAWSNVRDSLVWDKSSSDLGIGEAASVLNLSIDDLPHHLRKCFLSCSIYPEDFLIKRKILIRSWVAQGFVDEGLLDHRTRTAEDVADDYLDQLVQRSLMQAVVRNEYGRAKRCVVHDLIRELITLRSREEEGFFRFANCKVTVGSDIRVRNLALDRCEGVDSQSVPKVALLRSFHAFGSELDAAFLSRFRLLTVLNLWFIDMNKLPDSVTNLHNLRYLGIRSTLVQELPRDLGKLQKLQTLDCKLSMVQRLPGSTTKLKSLRHLILFTRHAADFWKPFPGTVVQLPQGLENLTSLQTLKYVQANTKTVRSLASLDQMRSLELSGLDPSHAADLPSSISRMRCLLRLGLELEPNAVLDLESVTPPPLKLQKLALAGRLARGKLPSWTFSLTSLTQLRLCGCEIEEDSLVLLAALPRLVDLSLIAAYKGRGMTFARGSFPTLQKLTLQDLPYLNHMDFQQGCLVNLHDLVLALCTKLTEIPRGMENLILLQNFETFGMTTVFVDKLKEQNGDVGYYKPASSESLNAPRLSRYLRWVGRNK
ncbi:unnamed protein product [Urochloa decumbens]|uniref:Uncharacterized protein n=1 Tax=Urochloa decumbens TaxID=240449 RepID=A0ABC9FCI5_9POAL